MPSMPSMPGSIATTSPGTSSSWPERPSPGGSWTSRPDAVAEAEVEAVVERLAGLAGALGRVAGALDDVAGGVVERAAGDAGAGGGAGGLERLAGDVAQRGDLVGDLAGADERAGHVGPAAAGLVAGPEVDLDRQAGRQRARSPGRGRRPRTGYTTMMSGGAGAPAAAHSARTASRTASAVSGSPVVVQQPVAARSRRLISALAGRHPALGGVLGAADALQLGGGLRAPAGLDGLGVDLDPARRRRAACRRPRRAGRAGTIACSIPHRWTARRTTSSSASSRVDAVGEHLVEAELVEQDELGVGHRLGDAGGLERAGEDRGAAVLDRDQQRVDDLQRDLVPDGGVANGVAVEKDRRHRPKASAGPVLTTSAAVAPPRRAVRTASSM